MTAKINNNGTMRVIFWAISTAVAAGGLAVMVKVNSQALTNQSVTLSDHDKRLRAVEQSTTLIPVMAEDLKDIKRYIMP